MNKLLIFWLLLLTFTATVLGGEKEEPGFFDIIERADLINIEAIPTDSTYTIMIAKVVNDLMIYLRVLPSVVGPIIMFGYLVHISEKTQFFELLLALSLYLSVIFVIFQAPHPRNVLETFIIIIIYLVSILFPGGTKCYTMQAFWCPMILTVFEAVGYLFCYLLAYFWGELSRGLRTIINICTLFVMSFLFWDILTFGHRSEGEQGTSRRKRHHSKMVHLAD